MRLGALIAALAIAACDTSPVNKTTDYQLPTELRDCKIFRVSGEWAQTLYIVRCPASVVSTTWTEVHSCGKNCTQNVPFSTTTLEVRP